MILNVNGKVSRYDPDARFTNPVTVTLAAGKYSLSDGFGQPGANYAAYNQHYRSHGDWYWNFTI
jgi:hypothetical protein